MLGCELFGSLRIDVGYCHELRAVEGCDGTRVVRADNAASQYPEFHDAAPNCTGLRDLPQPAVASTLLIATTLNLSRRKRPNGRLAPRSRVRMNVVYPMHLLRRLGRRNIEVHDDWLLVIAHDDAGKRFDLA